MEIKVRKGRVPKRETNENVMEHTRRSASSSPENNCRIKKLAYFIIREVSKDKSEIDINQIRVWAGELQELVGDE